MIEKVRHVPDIAGSIVTSAMGCWLRSGTAFVFKTASSKLFANICMGAFSSSLSNFVKAF